MPTTDRTDPRDLRIESLTADLDATRRIAIEALSKVDTLTKQIRLLTGLLELALSQQDSQA